MESILSKHQRQELGKALAAAGYDDANTFVYSETAGASGKYNVASLVNRDTSDSFIIERTDLVNDYSTKQSVPGTNRIINQEGNVWGQVLQFVQDWAMDVKIEGEAVDPWGKKAEEMANDDSYFTFEELPRVDRAIDESLDELKRLALHNGIRLEQVEANLQDAGLLLKKSARHSTKREWILLFRSIVIEKLVDWSMQTELFRTILHTLLVSAEGITQLATHASKFLPT